MRTRAPSVHPRQFDRLTKCDYKRRSDWTNPNYDGTSALLFFGFSRFFFPPVDLMREFCSPRYSTAVSTNVITAHGGVCNRVPVRRAPADVLKRPLKKWEILSVNFKTLFVRVYGILQIRTVHLATGTRLSIIFFIVFSNECDAKGMRPCLVIDDILQYRVVFFFSFRNNRLVCRP